MSCAAYLPYPLHEILHDVSNTELFPKFEVKAGKSMRAMQNKTTRQQQIEDLLERRVGAAGKFKPDGRAVILSRRTLLLTFRNGSLCSADRILTTWSVLLRSQFKSHVLNLFGYMVIPLHGRFLEDKNVDDISNLRCITRT